MLELTRNQQRSIERHPHLEERIRDTRTGPATEQPTPAPQRVPLPVCTHSGKLIDKTTCRCLVYECKVHGTCSNNSRAGLTVCPCDRYQSVPAS